MVESSGMPDLIRDMPKVELHLHIEGTLEPELMLEIGRRNGLDSPFGSVEEARRAYDFDGLSSFLAIYYQGTQVLRQEQDFYALTRSYLTRARTDNLRYSDDPAYFGGYINDNFLAAQQAMGLDFSEIHQLVRNSYEAAFLTAEEKQLLLDELEEFIAGRELASYDGP